MAKVKSYSIEYLPRAYKAAVERCMLRAFGERTPLQGYEQEIAFKYAMAGLSESKAAADIVAERVECQL